MEIRAKLSLAVNDFKSGLNTAKKELDSFGTSGSKFNSKFAKDVRSSFDQLGPNVKRSRREISREFDGIGKDIRSSIKSSLTNAWNPLQQGFSKASAKIGVNAAVIGGFFRSMTRDAAAHSKNVDSYINKNLVNRITSSEKGKVADMRNLTDFEKKSISSSRRMAKEAMLAQYGARDNTASKAAWLASNPTPAPASQFKDRIKLASFTPPAQDAISLKARVALYKQDAKELVASTAYKAKYEAVYQIGRAKRGAETFKKDSAAAWSGAKEFVAATAYKAKYEAVYLAGRAKQIAQARSAVAAESQAKKVELFNTQDFEKSMARTRYALYDVGQRLIAFGTSIAASLGQAVQAAIKFESAFTSVERTAAGVTDKENKLTGAGERLKKSLMDLATTTPISYEDITKVATLGAQMGIATDSLDKFTSTVTQFSAITGVSVDAAATAFGRLGQLLDVPASKFENLSSAITYAGVNSVATEAEILSMSESIAAASDQAGFAADEVIGMATALASLKVRPEEARGVLVRLFRTIDSSVSMGGAQLRDFGTLMGITSDEAKKLWQQDPNKFFTSFLQGANNAGNLNEAISALGITNSRELNVIQRLANNTDVLASSMADAHEQYLMGTYSAEAYSKVADDVASKLKMFQSAVEQAGASIGGPFAQALGTIASVLTTVLKSFAAAPAWLTGLISVLVAAAAGIILFKGAMFMAVAGLLAAKLAMKSLNIEGVSLAPSIANISALMQSMGIGAARTGGLLGILGLGFKKSKAAADSAAIANRGFMASLGWIGLALTAATTIAAIWGSAQQAAGSVRELGDAMIEAGGGSDELMKAVAKDTQVFEETGNSIGKLSVKMDAQSAAKAKLNAETLAGLEYADTYSKGMTEAADGTGKLADAEAVADAAQAKYNATLAQTNDLLKTQDFALGANTAAFMTNALAKYKDQGGNEQNFYSQFAGDTKNKTIAEAFGFNIATMVQKGMEKAGGSQEYITGIETEISKASSVFSGLTSQGYTAGEAIAQMGKQFNYSETQIAMLNSALGDGKSLYIDLPSYFMDGAKANDALRVSTEQTIAQQGIQKQALIDQGYSAEAAGDMVTGLSESLKKYLGSAIEVNAANNGAVDSFETFASGIKSTKGEMSGFSKSARDNIGNFQSFMNSSLEAATASGDGFVGGLARISAGLAVLKAQGKDTGEGFIQMRTWMVTAISAETSVVGAAGLATQLSAAQSTEAMIPLIKSWVATSTATGAAKTAQENYAKSLIDGLGGVAKGTDWAKAFGDAWKNAAVSTTKAKTALEALTDAIEKNLKKQQLKMNLEGAMDSLADSLLSGKKSFSVFTEEGRQSLGSLRGVIDSLSESSNGNKQVMANNLASLRLAMTRAGVTSTEAFAMIDAAMKATGKKGKTTATQVARDTKTLLSAIAGQATKVVVDTVRMGQKETKKSINDWVSDIKSVLADAFENRYGAQAAKDAITTVWNEIASSAADAAEAIRDAARAQGELTADKNILNYQLGIAVKYGDTLRAGAIRAKIAEKDAAIAAEGKKISDAQQSQNKTLVGDSQAAIDNRAKVRGLVQGYTEYLTALAKSGKSSEELKKEATKLSGEFLQQGKNMGFAEADLKSYTTAFETDFKTVINNLPSNITLKLDSTDPVITAIAAFVTAANEELAKITVIDLSGKTINGVDTGAKTDTSTDMPPAKVMPTSAEIKSYNKNKTDLANAITRSKRTGLTAAYKAAVAATIKAKTSAVKAFETKFGKGYKDGGLIMGPGTGTSDSIPAMLSNREYVVNAAAVKHYGTDFMNAINQMRVSSPMPSSAGAGTSNSGSGVVYLSPDDRQLLRAAIDRPITLYADNQKIAQSANAGNVVLAQRGSK